MCAITILSVYLLFVVTIYTDIGSTDALITCEAGTFEEGKPASISCKFRTNITASKRSINMALYPPDEPKGAIGKDILLCRWSEEKKDHLCFLEENNYTFDNIMTDHLTVRIPAVSSGQAGLYMCFFVPPEGTDAYPCELIVVSGKTKVNQNFLLIIVPCVVGVVAVVCCVALFVVIRKRRNKSSRRDQDLTVTRVITWDTSTQTFRAEDTEMQNLDELLEDFHLDMQTLRKLMKLMNQEISNGVDESKSMEAVTKAFPPFVSHLTDGTGNGVFLVLDFDGDHLKTVLVKLQDRRASVMKSKRYTFSVDSKTGEAKNKLFYFIADCTNQFVKDFDMSITLRIALMVAFPCKYEGQQTVRLVKWTKEINHEGIVGEDLHSLLREALTVRRKEKWTVHNKWDNLNKLEVVAVVNDAAGTLMSVADKVPNCKIGLIVGNGLNACYAKDLTNVETDSLEDDKPQEMIVNTELGALGENGYLDFCRTAYDKLLDKQSNFHESQVLEKMVGGRYIGELVRLVLEGLTKEGLLFRSVPSRDALFKRDSFSTERVFNIDNDTEDTEEPYKQTSETLTGLGVKNASQEDLQTVHHVCKAVCQRAAFLTAASLATLINRVKQPEVTVVVDGYLYRRHPRFHDLMYSKTLELVKPERKFYLVSPRYDRSIGAARIVAASLRSSNPQTVNT